MNNNYYSWHSELWHRLVLNPTKLPHALLLSGPAGIGKLDFAYALSKFLLCTHHQNATQACCACPSCHWFSDGTHPDFREITLEQDSSEDTESASKKKTKKSQISVSQIRELGDFLNLSSHQSNGVKVALIQPADALNQASANALLKMLEEPPKDVVFILVTHQLNRLLPTILSRCHKLIMPAPTRLEAISWLESQGVKNAQYKLDYHGGSPLLALRQNEKDSEFDEIWRQLALGAKVNPFSLAPYLLKHGAETALCVLQKWVYDLLASKSSNEVRYHTEFATAINTLAKSASEKKLFLLQTDFANAKMSSSHPLNWELQIEALLLRYTQLFEKQS